ncbi:hypothetical protein [Gemmata sp.]|uniref:hypothetical protein n=1 Tax=Gemmata sp. TaxID=1914242 RepID=UPI003F700D47
MTCKTERGATGARPKVPAPIAVGDVITLANDAHATPLTVLAIVPGSGGATITRWFARGYDIAGQVVERIVSSLEIATAKRLMPLAVTGPDGKPVEVEKPLGLSEILADLVAHASKSHFLTFPQDPACPKREKTAEQPKPAGKLVWLPPDSRGETSTHCKRFAVVKTAEGMFRGVDQRSARHQFSVRFTFPDSARAWCEDQFDIAGDGPSGPPVVAPAPVANVPGLEWITNGADKQGRPTAWASKCGRFCIWPTVEKDGTYEGVWYCVDLAVNTSGCGSGGSVGQAYELCRFSPNACLDDVKRWATERSLYTLGKDAQGKPCLLLTKPSWPNGATKADEPVLPVEVQDWTDHGGM